MEAEEPQSRPQSSRKSVTFTEEKLVVGADGSVTMVASPNEPKETAESHSPQAAELADGAADNDGLDLSLMKKKKKKVKKVEEPGAGGSDDEAPAGGDDDAIDLSMKKKKKKKAAAAGGDDFVKKLEALKVRGDEGEEGAGAADTDADGQDGDMEKGTGVWEHSEVAPVKYDLLLSRFFELLAQKNPDHALSGSRSYKIPPPQCLREGNKKTIFANIAEICKRMKRTDEHVTAYLFAELGTTGSVDGSRRLVIKGRFQQKQIENVLRKYIIEYVTCRTCRSPDTELVRGENRLYFVTCNSCGSRRSVLAIKTGFSAQVGKRRKMKV